VNLLHHLSTRLDVRRLLRICERNLKKWLVFGTKSIHSGNIVLQHTALLERLEHAHALSAKF
jgi:hypothetical protein